MSKLNFPSKTSQKFYAEMQKMIVDDEIVVIPHLNTIQMSSAPFSPKYAILSFIKSGWVKGKYNRKDIQVSAGDVCIVPQFSVISLEEYSDDFDAELVIFVGNSKMGKLIKNQRPVKYIVELYHRPVVTPTPDVWPIIMKGVSLLEDVSACDSLPNRSELMRHIFDLLFDSVYKAKKFKPKTGVVKSRAEHTFEAFTNEVLRNIGKSHKVSFYADLLCITPNYLSKVCQQVAQVSAHEIINILITRQSQYILLNDKKLSVQEISDMMGFPNQSFFAKFFKQRVGMSPTQYKTQR